MYKMEINLPNTPRGQLVEVDGLGIFENGSEVFIDKEQAEAFRAKHEKVVVRSTKRGLSIVDVKPGLTVLQAFERVEGITVTTSDKANAAPVVKQNTDTGSPANDGS